MELSAAHALACETDMLSARERPANARIDVR